ncbi:cupin domain-containing protein [Siccirubricoccus deserti]
MTVHVLEGVFTLEMEGRETATVRAGEVLVEPPGVRMTGYNRGDGPLRVLILYVSEPGAPFLDPIH